MRSLKLVLLRSSCTLSLGRGLLSALGPLLLVVAHHLLESRAVVQIHLLESLIDLLEDAIELFRFDMGLDNREDSAELLVLLLEAQLLVHVSDSLLEAGLER